MNSNYIEILVRSRSMQNDCIKWMKRSIQWLIQLWTFHIFMNPFFSQRIYYRWSTWTLCSACMQAMNAVSYSNWPSSWAPKFKSHLSEQTNRCSFAQRHEAQSIKRPLDGVSSFEAFFVGLLWISINFLNILSTGLPVVNKNWLLDCYKAKKRLALRNYLVGDSIAPVDDIEDDDDEVLCSQSVMLPESARDSMKGNDSDNFQSFNRFCVKYMTIPSFDCSLVSRHSNHFEPSGGTAPWCLKTIGFGSRFAHHSGIQ